MTTKNRTVPAIGAALVLLCLGAAPAFAEGSGRVSSSTGHLLNAADGTDGVIFAVGVGQEKAADKYIPDGVAASKPRSAVRSQSLNTDFWIYDANAVVYFDYDDDGFFTGLDVSFDADTVYFSADVYARLYLSFEGGPWILYYTTDVFTLFSASGVDDYMIETDLIDGYPTGYYDVLIELYDYDFDDHVASFGPYESSALSELPLEDEARDVTYVPTLPPVPPVSYSSGGGGSAGLLLLSVALLTLALRRSRFAAGQSPAGETGGTSEPDRGRP